MRKLTCIIGALAIVLAAALVAKLSAQRAGSALIELCPPITLAPTSTNVTGVVPAPLGKEVRGMAGMTCILRVTQMQTIGSPQIVAYFQSSADDGQTWNDFAQVDATSTGTYYVPVSLVAAGSSTVQTLSDGQLSNNTAVQGPIGNRIRIKYNLVTANAGLCSFQAFVRPN
jgi:hypothetical protein